MNLMSRLTADVRHARRLRDARAQIRRAERAEAAKRNAQRRLPRPGYDELSDPVFMCTMVVAVFVIVLDIRGDIDTSFVIDGLRGAAAALRSWL